MARNRVPPEEPERPQEERPSEQEAEPEGGPSERERQFLEERLTP